MKRLWTSYDVVCGKQIVAMTKGFDWHLNPFLIWMRIIGLGNLASISNNSTNSKFKTRFFICLSYGMAAAALIIHAMEFRTYFEAMKSNGSRIKPNNTERNITSTHLASMGIQQVNLGIFSVGCHVSFFMEACILNKWENLRNILNDIQKNLNLDKKFYRKCFKWSFMFKGLATQI